LGSIIISMGIRLLTHLTTEQEVTVNLSVLDMKASIHCVHLDKLLSSSEEGDRQWLCNTGNVCIMCHLFTGGCATSEHVMKPVEFDV